MVAAIANQVINVHNSMCQLSTGQYTQHSSHSSSAIPFIVITLSDMRIWETIAKLAPEMIIVNKAHR